MDFNVLLLSTVLLLFMIKISPTEAQNRTDIDDLLKKLFVTDNYNKKIRPIANQSSPVVVPVEIILNSIIEFDEQNEVLKTAGFLNVYWDDNFLTWNSSDYGGIEEIFVPQDDIWKPDLSLSNSYVSFTGLGSAFLNVRVGAEGDVHWRPMQVLESTCSVDITYFPFDVQKCELKFTAWSYNMEDVLLNAAGTESIKLDEYSPNNQWDLVDSTTREVKTAESAVIFEFTLKRKPSFYILNVVVPVVLLSLLNAATFILPVASGEKAGYSITVFLSLAVFLTIVASELPKNSERTSLLSVYLMLMTILSTIIVLLCLTEIRLGNRNMSVTPINRGFRFLYRVSMICQCRPCNKRTNPIQPAKEVKVKDNTKKQKQGEAEDVSDDEQRLSWIDIVDALDFMFFWTFLVLTFLCTIMIFAIASIGSKQ